MCVVDDHGRILEGRRYRHNESVIRALCSRLWNRPFYRSERTDRHSIWSRHRPYIGSAAPAIAWREAPSRKPCRPRKAGLRVAEARG